MVFTVERWSFAAGNPASLIPQSKPRDARVASSRISVRNEALHVRIRPIKSGNVTLRDHEVWFEERKVLQWLRGQNTKLGACVGEDLCNI